MRSRRYRRKLTGGAQPPDGKALEILELRVLARRRDGEGPAPGPRWPVPVPAAHLSSRPAVAPRESEWLFPHQPAQRARTVPPIGSRPPAPPVVLERCHL